MEAVDILDFMDVDDDEDGLDGALVYLGPEPRRSLRPAPRRQEPPEPPKPPTVEDRMAGVEAQVEQGWAAADETFTDMQAQIDRLHKESVKEKHVSRLFWENFRRRVMVDAKIIFWAVIAMFFISILVRVMVGPGVIH